MFWLKTILAIVMGYLIGSLSPAYLLGKILKGIDIREYGSKNAGAMNAFHLLGIKAGITTFLFDLIKGLLAMVVAYLLLFGLSFDINYFSGLPFFIICLAGFVAILGHDFPFYMNFRGGKGAATAGGIMLFLLFLLFQPHWFTTPITETPGAIPSIIIAFFGLSIILISGSANLAAFIGYPLFITSLLFFNRGPITYALIFFVVYSLVIALINIFTRAGKLKGDLKFAKVRKGEIKIYRKIIRFTSLIFPIAYFWLPKTGICWLVGSFLALFLVLEFVKKTKVGRALYKKGEAKISGYTLFLTAALFTVLLFEKEVAIIALIFAAVGGNAAVLLGIPFGKRKLIASKTLEGTIACLASCFLAGLIVKPFLEVGFLLIMAGAAAATLVELFSGRYDNLTMAPLAALAMTFFKI